MAASATKPQRMRSLRGCGLRWRWFKRAGLIALPSSIHRDCGGSRSRALGPVDRGGRTAGGFQEVCRGRVGCANSLSPSGVSGLARRLDGLSAQASVERGLSASVNPRLLATRNGGVESGVPQPHEPAPLLGGESESKRNVHVRGAGVRVLRKPIKCREEIEFELPLVVRPFSRLAPPVSVRLGRGSSCPIKHGCARHSGPESKGPENAAGEARSIPYLSETSRRHPLGSGSGSVDDDGAITV